MNDILENIVKAVRREYFLAEGNAVYDQESHNWFDSDGVMDHYDFVHDELNYYLESDNGDFLREIEDNLEVEEWMPKNKFSENQEEIDMERWNKYCELVRSTPLSAEQIVGLINPENTKNIPDDLRLIRDILKMVYRYCKKFGLVKFIEGINSNKRAADIYRCVNYLDWNHSYAGLEFIPATMVGTAPPKNVADSRMSEQGDMMFYGADNQETAMIEVGYNMEYASYPATIGTFHSNKKFRILDLSKLCEDKLPSIFDITKARDRSIWFFLNEFIEKISQLKNDKYTYYKPTQVFTKFIQRNTDMQGIKYKSSRSNGGCYVLFVVNRDCLDNGNKIDIRRSQLVMDKVEQIDFYEAGICHMSDLGEKGYYFILKGKDEEIDLYRKIADNKIDIFKQNDKWYLSSCDIRSESDYVKSRCIAEDTLNILHGLVAFYRGCCYAITIDGYIKHNNGKSDEITVDMDGTVNVVNEMTPDEICVARELFSVSLLMEKQNEYRLASILRLLRKDTPLDLYDAYKIIELVKKDTCKEIIGYDVFNCLCGNINNAEFQGEQARHSRAYTEKKQGNKKKDEKEKKPLTRVEINEYMKSIIMEYFKITLEKNKCNKNTKGQPINETI